ncbi:MAG: glycosyltransferase family 2 protein [Candidatus Shapirobacteria bacterium]|nr:glycosyltransferase family 2 protein [Candidatus Shapirobacteria bacterium]
MTSHLNLSLIIPNYNGSKFIIDCLQSLQTAIKKCPQSKFEIIIVDNGSTDNSLFLIKTFFQNNKLINLASKIYRLTTNSGFAHAINQGIQQSQYKYIVLINNDLTLEENWFKLILKSITENKNPKIASYFGTILNKDGTKYESQGLKFFPSGKCLNISNNQPFSKSSLKPCPVKGGEREGFFIWAGSGALIVYQKEILQKIGNFDPDFFAYLEDVDVAFRLNQFGYQTLYIPQAVSYHLGGGTSNSINNLRYRMDVRNWFYLIIKNYSAKEFWSNFFPITIERLRNLSCLIKKSIPIYRIKSIWLIPKDLIQIFFDVLKNLTKMRQKYHQTQKLLKSTK